MKFLAPVLLAASLVACTSTQQRPAGEPAYATSLRPQIKQLMADMLVPGAVVAVRTPDRGNWTEAFGVRERGGKDSVTVDDYARIGSCTKTWTGQVILQLVEEGKIALSDPVSKYRKDVPNGDNITIEQLLDMRSGLYNYSETLPLNKALDDTPTRVWQPDELLALAYQEKPYFAPGKGYHYSNTNTVLLGLIIQQLTGMPVEKAFEERLFKPLGLTHMVMPALSDSSMPTPHPHGYQYGTNVATLDSQVLSAEDQAKAKAGTLVPRDKTDTNPSWGWTAGAGMATAGDLATYVKAMVTGRYLDADMLKKLLGSVRSTDPTNPQAASYGWGLAKLGPFYGHTGELPGFNTFMGYDPVTKITIVVWANLSAAPDGRPPANVIAKAIMDGLKDTGSTVQEGNVKGPLQ